ncbi:hypothetical protein NDU88_003972 [Pleurodeles waltl]|uniref:Uncharacterized protein n=1 Tax=Pleurodeles waltl TaxID=8319 RepID=A0AAV7W646_PLEWA|nr:hypothetical protein NDU88_003972 [Pleurodeles waltl]
MAQGRSNTSTFFNAPISSTGRPRYLRDSVMVHSLSPVHAPPHSVLGTFGPKMAAATSKVRLIDSRRRPSVSVRRSAVQMSPLLPPSGVPHLVGVVRTFRQRPALRAAARQRGHAILPPRQPGAAPAPQLRQDPTGSLSMPGPSASRLRHGSGPAAGTRPRPESGLLHQRAPSGAAAGSALKPHFPPIPRRP